jgi:Tol biopolymer transport system component/DNA-binding winged helix-turn-helix (wHTH) protein
MTASDLIRFGSFELDRSAYRMRRDGAVVPLEPKALEVLLLLIDCAPRVVDKAEIFARVWKDVAVTDNALTRVVAQLRKALDDDARAPRYIETVATRGYRFVAEVVLPTDLVASAGGRASHGPASSATAAVHRGPGEASDRVAPVDDIAHTPAPPSPASTRPAPRTWWVAAGLVAAAAVAALALFSSLTASPERSPDAVDANATAAPAIDTARYAGLVPRQLTTGTGYDGFAAFAPDGHSVAFVSDVSGSLEIHVQGLAPGSVPVPLTANGRQNVHPAWSPDGQFIAYHEISGDGIWVQPSRGGVARRLSDFGSDPAWSPDGRLIAFSSRRVPDLGRVGAPLSASTIWIVDPRTGESRALTRQGTPPGPHLSPVWTEDSRHVVFAATAALTADESTSLWRADATTGSLDRVAAHPRLNGEFALAPGGRGIYIAALGMLWWQALDAQGHASGDPIGTGLSLMGNEAAQLTISRDGRQLAWSALEFSGGIWRSDRNGAGTAPLAVSLGVRYTTPISASDGRLAMVAQRRGSPGSLYVMAPGGPLRPVVDDGRAHVGPYWMPGERELASIVIDGGKIGYETIDIETGKVRRLFEIADLPLPDGWRRLGTSIANNIVPNRAFSAVALTLVRDGVPNIWVASLTGGRPDGRIVQRTFDREGGSFPAWSDDGRWIAYECFEGSDTHVCLTGADPTDGDGRRLTHEAGQSWVNAYGWNGDEILFAANRRGLWNIQSVPRSGGPPATWSIADGPRFFVRYPRPIRPAGGVVYERDEVTARIFSVTLP